MPVSGIDGSGLEFRFRVSGSGFWVSGFGFRGLGFRFRVQGLGFQVQGSGFWVSAFWFRVWGMHQPDPVLQNICKAICEKSNLIFVH